jgi:hypothetical protein
MSFKITAEADLWESRGTFTLGKARARAAPVRAPPKVGVLRDSHNLFFNTV